MKPRLELSSQPVVDKIKTLIIAMDPEWFNTPMLEYLSMKKEYLGKFLDSKQWGEFGSEKQVIAIFSFLEYFKKTRSLADQFPQLMSEITIENKNLVLQRTLPFSNKLYEQLLLAVVEGADEQYQSFWDQPSNVTLSNS